MSRCGSLRLLRRHRHRVEADVGEEDHRRAAEDAARAELAERAGVGRQERRVVLGPEEPRRHRTTISTMTVTLIVTITRSWPPTRCTPMMSSSVTATHDQTAGRLSTAVTGSPPGTGTSVPGAALSAARERNADVAEEAQQVARPAHRHRGRAQGVLQDQVPADDPGDELAQRGVGIGVGRARRRAPPRRTRHSTAPASALARPASTIDSTMAGPACAPAACPVSTKMPAPMTPPMPRRTRSARPSTRRSACWPDICGASLRGIAMEVLSEQGHGKEPGPKSVDESARRGSRELRCRSRCAPRRGPAREPSVARAGARPLRWP